MVRRHDGGASEIDGAGIVTLPPVALRCPANTGEVVTMIGQCRRGWLYRCHRCGLHCMELVAGVWREVPVQYKADARWRTQLPEGEVVA